MKTIFLLLCLLAATSRAAIITGTIPEENRLFLIGQRPFDFDGDGYTDLTFAGSDPGVGFLRVVPGSAGFSRPTTYLMAGAESPGPDLAVLSYGTTISAANESYTGILGPYARVGSIYNWNGGFWSPGPWSGQTGYLGFAFTTPPAGPDDGYTAHYGWFRMAELNGVLELYEWAYETQDNTALYAGQVPEPSQAACLCAGIAMCFLRRNRTV